jgi:serine protease Do
MKRKIGLFILSIISILSLTSCFSLGNSGNKQPDEIQKEPSIVEIQNDITTIYEKISKGCVGIYGSSNDSASGGSGVIYKEVNGLYYVVTNAHVIEEMTKIQIFLGGVKYYNATLVGKDSKNDIAVLTFSLDMFGGEVYVHDIFNYEEELIKVGQTTLAIGCPLDLDNYNTLTTGVVSKVTYSQIMTNAELNPGNSGGGLFNLSGRLIGINTEKQVWTSSVDDYGQVEQIPVEGVGYAVSLEVVKKCITDVESKGGNIERPLMGITVTGVNTYINSQSEYIKYFPQGLEFGIIVLEISKDSAAGKAGVLPYDVITKIDGKDVTSMNTISDVLNSKLMSDSVTLTIYRQLATDGNKVVEITVSFQ